MVSEKRLVRRLQRGEAKAYAEFVDAYGARVHHLVGRYVDNPSDAEDVTQEIFCDLHRCVGGFRGTPLWRPGSTVWRSTIA
jgi:RNA polymerase sigma-70 factor, ECF subfamily